MTFHFKGGRSAQNLEEFLSVLSVLPEEEYQEYVSRDDFANWVRGALGMSELASRISGIESRQTIIEHVRRAVESSRLPSEPLLPHDVIKQGIRQGLAEQEVKKIVPAHVRHPLIMRNFVAGMLMGSIVGIVIGVLLVWL